MGGNVKIMVSLKRNHRLSGLRKSRGPLVQHLLAIETAIGAQIAHLAPKNEENVGPMAPKVAPGSPKGIPLRVALRVPSSSSGILSAWGALSHCLS